MGDLILADTSEDRLDAAKGIEVIFENNYPVISGLHTIHLRERNNHTIPNYKTYLVASKSFRYFARKYCEGIKVFSIKPSLLKYTNFSYPANYKEQEKIVVFLTLIDKKINLVNRKIETLKKYKEGYSKAVIKSCSKNNTMLSSICDITTGKLDANAMSAQGKYKFFTCSREDYLIDTYAFDCEAILVSGNGDVGLSKYYRGKFNAYQRTYVLHNFKRDPLFIQICIDSQIKSVIRKETNKGAMPYIKLSTFDKLIIPDLAADKEKIVSANIKLLKNKEKLLTLELEALSLIKKYLLNMLFI